MSRLARWWRWLVDRYNLVDLYERPRHIFEQRTLYWHRSWTHD